MYCIYIGLYVQALCCTRAETHMYMYMYHVLYMYMHVYYVCNESLNGDTSFNQNTKLNRNHYQIKAPLFS